jgi:hypothetical protein
MTDPNRPRRMLRSIGAVLAGGPEFDPRWYALVIIAIALPCAWAGGKLHERAPA